MDPKNIPGVPPELALAPISACAVAASSLEKGPTRHIHGMRVGLVFFLVGGRECHNNAQNPGGSKLTEFPRVCHLRKSSLVSAFGPKFIHWLAFSNLVPPGGIRCCWAVADIA